MKLVMFTWLRNLHFSLKQLKSYYCISDGTPSTALYAQWQSNTYNVKPMKVWYNTHQLNIRRTMRNSKQEWIDQKCNGLDEDVKLIYSRLAIDVLKTFTMYKQSEQRTSRTPWNTPY